LVQWLAEELAHAAGQAEGHGEVEAGAFFAYVGGCEIDGYALAIRKFKTAISQGGFDALPAFLHSVVREAYNVKVLHARGAYVYPDFNEIGVDSIHGSADGFKEHSFGRSLNGISLKRGTVGREAAGVATRSIN
jgi:hypothetical protein